VILLFAGRILSDISGEISSHDPVQVVDFKSPVQVVEPEFMGLIAENSSSVEVQDWSSRDTGARNYGYTIKLFVILGAKWHSKYACYC